VGHDPSLLRRAPLLLLAIAWEAMSRLDIVSPAAYRRSTSWR
jgi:hypothetical protein